VIRGVHLIPGFHYGRTDTRLGPSFVRPPEDKDTDWLYFYVNQYVFIILYAIVTLNSNLHV
jgi:hypothetical protein